MMTTEMQDHFPFEPPPPPSEPVGAAYGHWSADPGWGPPQWPPTSTPPAAGRSRALNRVLIAGLAVVCVGAGGGTAWAITSATLTNPSTTSSPSGSNNGVTNPGNGSGNNGVTSPTNGGATASSAEIARIDAATVDIDASTATHQGEVAGTGMIITSSGLVLTNNHVIDDDIDITAQIDGAGTVYKATVVGYDATDDVALVQLQNASNLPTVPLGDSSLVSVGDSLTVIGNALGKGGTPAVVSGVVSQLDQAITASDESGDTENLTGMLEVQAEIQPGDSGGPEINSQGKVIGMTTAGQQSDVPSGQEATATTGFAIPINKAIQIVDEIRAGSGPNVHIGNAAELGIGVNPEGTTGAVVANVLAGSPAANAGIVAGDLIVKIDNSTITSANDLHRVMENYSSGQSLTFVWTDPITGASHTATITLALAAWAD
jgi:S1-C subfamily serine protease